MDKPLECLQHSLLEAEEKLLTELRTQRQRKRTVAAAKRSDETLTTGQKIADWVAAAMGSWPFIIGQSIILTFWIVLNVTAWIKHWDPYPFILLNLALSFQAAYAAPFIMMAQNRQQDIDRKQAQNDYQINIKAELEIELLHQKIDELREKEVVFLTQAIQDLTLLLHERQAAAAKSEPAQSEPALAAPAKPARTTVSRKKA